MPSPRAVLTDIHDLDLDPTHAYTNTKASGRLAFASNSNESIVEAIPAPQPIVEAIPAPQPIVEAIPAPQPISQVVPTKPKLKSKPVVEHPNVEIESKITVDDDHDEIN